MEKNIDMDVTVCLASKLIPAIVKGLMDFGFNKEADKVIMEALINKKNFVDLTTTKTK